MRKFFSFLFFANTGPPGLYLFVPVTKNIPLRYHTVFASIIEPILTIESMNIFFPPSMLNKHKYKGRF